MLDVVSCPPKMKVMPLSFTSGSVICSPHCGQHGAEHVARGIRVRGQAAAPLGDGDSQRRVERFRRRAHAEPSEPRNEVRKADDVERIAAAACLVVPDRRCPDRLRTPSPSEKMQPTRASSATRLISLLISQTLPSGGFGDA